MKTITVVTTVRGTEPLLGRTITDLRATAGQPIKVVVVYDDQDQGSGSELADVVLRSPTRLGPAGCRHLGLKTVNKGIALVCDPHVRLTQGWATQVSRFYNNPRNSKTTCCFLTGHLKPDFEPEDPGIHGFHSGADLVLLSDNSSNSFRSSVLDWRYCFYQAGEPCGCVMGAVYTIPVTWYNRSQPWAACTAWGQAEAYLSINNWLLGGCNKVFPADVKAWHCFCTPWTPESDPQDVWVHQHRLWNLLPMPTQGLWEHCSTTNPPGDPDYLKARLALDLRRPECQKLKTVWAAGNWDLVKPWINAGIPVLSPAPQRVVKPGETVVQPKAVNPIENPRCTRCGHTEPMVVKASWGTPGEYKCMNCNFRLAI